MFCPARLPARHDEGVAAELAGDGAGIAQHAGAKRTRVAVAIRNAWNLAWQNHYQPESSGNRFVNFTLVRGSAIIGATVSRQSW